MVPDDLLRIRWLSDAQVAPDGRRVAFVVTTLDVEGDGYRSAVWSVEATGGEPRRLTRGEGRDASPRWSPDGSRLVFVADRGGEKGQLFVMPELGGEQRKLTAIELGVANPVWSPAGRYVCFVGRVPAEPQLEGSGDGANPKTPPARVITTLKYKLNGEGFTYDKRRHLYVVDIESGEVRQLTDGDFDDVEPAWSPDGRTIAFVSARHDDRDYDRVKDLFVIDASGGEPRRLTDGSFTLAAPAWSPNGRSIAFLGHRSPGDTPRHDRLWVVEPGSEPRCLSESLDLNLVTGATPGSGPLPCWSADGAAIFVAVQERGNVPIYRVELAGGTARRVVAGERSVGSFSLDVAGRSIAFVASDSAAPAELFVTGADGANERRLTGLNDAWRAEVELPRPERLQVRHPDGTELDAWLMRPAGYAPGTAHPLLVNIHGGPYAQYGYSFLDELQVQAGAGFGVLFCNPRGSSGYGEAFARSIIGEPGVKDSEDVLAALDQALATFQDIDRQRLGVLGGSYGGYLTSWIVGHTDRFAAACSERGINNRLSKAGTDDINTTWAYFRSEPYRDPELFLRLSPLMYAEAMVTPLLIMHSEEDLRCPIEQAEQLYTALKRLRRDVLFVRFPGENHDLSRSGKASHRLQRFRIQLDFFRDRLGLAAIAEAQREPAAAPA
jgi:dipeptidyl aminopeptidase/acylaminoacyl peptidase